MTQAANLDRLATHLENLPKGYLHFDMESFFHDPREVFASEREEMAHSIDLLEPVLGMCACALGHSAAAGIVWNPSAFPDWRSFAKATYGLTDDDYDFLFGGEWYVTDNTPAGAAARMRVFLRDGTPGDWLVSYDELEMA